MQSPQYPKSEVVAYIGLGANLGDRVANILEALRQMRAIEGARVTSVSSLWETGPVGRPDQPDFVNAAAEVKAVLSARELLERLQAIELGMGRLRFERWGPRVIDLDILLYGGRVVSEPDLTIPHSQMHLRRFVLGPLSQIAPDARHPVLGMSVRELLGRLGDSGRYRTLRSPCAEVCVR